MDTITLDRPSTEVAVLTLSRPEKLNAITFAMVEELHDALDEVDRDNACRVLILTGEGRGFCSGLDLTAIEGSPVAVGASGPRGALMSQARIADLIPHLRRIQQPVIAAVNGPAFGGGFALALGSDLRIATDTARFCTQFIKVGVSGCDIGVSYTLPRLIGGARAHELILTARQVQADEALSLGIVTEIVPAEALLDRAMELAGTLCSYSPFGVVMTKQVMWTNLDASSLEAAIELENRTQILAGFGGEVREAAVAFLEGRPPNWEA